jgi:hypothetical protein
MVAAVKSQSTGPPAAVRARESGESPRTLGAKMSAFARRRVSPWVRRFWRTAMCRAASPALLRAFTSEPLAMIMAIASGAALRPTARARGALP